MIHKVESTLTQEILSSPKLWSNWLAEKLKNGFDYNGVADSLDTSISDIALARRAFCYYMAYNNSAFLVSVKSALMIPDDSIKFYVTVLLIQSEYPIETRQGEDTQAPAISKLSDILNTINKTRLRSDFDLEVKMYTLYSLIGFCNATNQNQRALELSSEGLNISLALDLDKWSATFRMSYGLASYRLGKAKDAIVEYSHTLDNHTSPRRYFYSALNLSLVHLATCNYHRAIKVLNEVQDHVDAEKYSDKIKIALSTAKLHAGIPIDIPIDELTENDKILFLLQRAAISGRSSDFNCVLPELKNMKLDNTSSNDYSLWCQAYTLFKVGNIFSAEQRLAQTQLRLPLARLLIFGLKIEIAMRHNGDSPEQTGLMVAQVQELFGDLNAEERVGAAQILSIWHPLSASFIAYSPYYIKEVVDESASAVVKIGRPSIAYGKPLPVKITLLQKALEDFGIEFQHDRGYSTEKERMKSALEVQHYGCKRQLPLILPSTIAFHYAKIGKSSGGLWLRAARELSRSHGLVAKTSAGSFNQIGEHFGLLLERFVETDFTYSEFQLGLNMITNGILGERGKSGSKVKSAK